MKSENAWTIGCIGTVIVVSFLSGLWVGLWCLDMAGIPALLY